METKVEQKNGSYRIIETSKLEESSNYYPEVGEGQFFIDSGGYNIDAFDFEKDSISLSYIQNYNSFKSIEVAEKEQSKRLFIMAIREYAYACNGIKDWFPERNEESYMLILPPTVVYFKSLVDRQKCLDRFEQLHKNIFDSK